MNFQRLLLTSGIVVLGVAATPAFASTISPLTITPTFEASITGDTNAVAIEATINAAISFYTTNLTTATPAPIDVTIDFQEGGGLGGSLTGFYGAGYAGPNGVLAALTAASSGDATDTTALAGLPATEPISGHDPDTVAITSANIRALGANAPGFVDGTFDGQITLNTSLTTPGSPSSSGQYSLLAVTEHEIDEVLGLGSDEGGTGFFSDTRMEDLFRYTTGGARAWNQSTVCDMSGNGPVAYFSLDGMTPLSYFNNCNNGGDFGDWYSVSGDWPGFGPQVQDAFATPGSSPSLNRNSTEVVALDAIGYNLAAVATPEPGTLALLFGGMAAVGYYRRRRF